MMWRRTVTFAGEASDCRHVWGCRLDARMNVAKATISILRRRSGLHIHDRRTIAGRCLFANASHSAVLGAALYVAATFGALCQEAPGHDPFKYCASVKTDDAVRPIPPGLVPQALQLFYLQPVHPQQVRRSTVYRCMDGAAWLCNYGANLVCAKADVSRVSRGAERYCRENPGSGVVPMAATGHATIYSWECVGNKARIKGSSVPLDRRGFIADQWKRLAE
jgi:hypothetical protein